jgi:hypothetical protein
VKICTCIFLFNKKKKEIEDGPIKIFDFSSKAGGGQENLCRNLCDDARLSNKIRLNN